METLFNALASASFLQSLALLVIGAALTGVIVPVVKYRMDKNGFEQQKRFEHDLARQAELVKARAQFLRDLADPVWQFQLLALQVSYDYGASEEKYEAALKSYDEQSWQHLKQIRAIVGGARWFTSEAAYHALTEFVDGWLIREVDMTLARQRRDLETRPEAGTSGSGRPRSWTDFNRWLYAESRSRTDALLVTLANDFDLSPTTSASVASRGTS